MAAKYQVYFHDILIRLQSRARKQSSSVGIMSFEHESVICEASFCSEAFGCGALKNVAPGTPDWSHGESEPREHAHPEAVYETRQEDGCWMCNVSASRKCPTCVFEEVKAGTDVDKTELLEAVNMYQVMLGTCSTSLAQKQAEMMAKTYKISMIVQKMHKDLSMLRKITDNELKFSGNRCTDACLNSEKALLHSYAMHIDDLTSDACKIFGTLT